MSIVKLSDITTNLDNRRKPLNGEDRNKISFEKKYPYCGANNIMDFVDDYLFDEEILCIAEDGGKWGLDEICSYIMYEKCWVNNHAHVIKVNNKNSTDIRYLKYWLNHKDLNNLITGAIVKKLTQKSLNNIEIDMPSIDEQKKVCSNLDSIQNLIDIKKEQINKLNELIKSQFVDMFMNDNYPKEKLKKNIEEMFIGPFGSALKNECFVDESNGYCVVYEQKHAINKNISDFRWVSESKYNDLKRFNVVPGDIIVSCRGTIGKTYVIPENAPYGIMHPSIMKIRLKKNKYIPRFFEMILENYLYKNEKQTNGATIKMGIKASILENENFIVPDMNTQIGFLNIVKLIDKQKSELEKSIKKLEELQVALMQEYFG